MQKAKGKIENKELEKSSNQFPVVGIGASAGGLDAFKKLLKAIPENSGMAYVLVQHLDPKHESLLPELLQKVTCIPVREISDDIKVEPDHIYIIPSNKMMIANDGVLELSPRPAKNRNERNLPIDLFFTSLAEVHQSHAIGVVLSGTASDGTLGLKAIKDHGGITFAQDEESAAYEGMPHSAVQAGVVDFILPPGKIPEKLLEVTRIINGNGHEEKPGSSSEPPGDEDVFRQILALLRLRKGTDFTYYKQTTIRRRMLRRMALNKKEVPASYLTFLRENKQEQDVLFQDLLIPVTSFFRDSKSFDNLCETIFPIISKSKTPGEVIRVWVAGCSTGQEVYSIAICLKEFLGYNGFPEGSVQIFATDISEPAIVKARTGIYAKSEVEGLTPQRLQEFFTKTNGSYQANKSIRDMCVFAIHNFLKDPPFGKMDFVSCRNVLIYMEPYLQKKAFTIFHYALNPKGFLLLGKSESIGNVSELFSSAIKHDKIFTRKDVPGRFIHTATLRSEQNYADMNMTVKSENIRTDFQKTADDIILGKFSPAGVVINEAMDIVHFRGSTGNYLEPSPGKASLNILKMAKNGLGFELRNILHKAKKDNAAVIKENIQMQSSLPDGQPHRQMRNISIEAIPLPNMVEPHYLVLFHEEFVGNKQLATGKKSRKDAGAKQKNDEKDLRILQLEKELAQTREDMRSITEDQEAVNEELQSANEELLSGSEELQSLNEEMETSKEELQSTNEELMVVNQEMIGLNEQVSDAKDYAEAIVTTVREPLLVLDKNLRVKSANSAFYKTFQVNELETEGRLIYDLGDRQWNIPKLRTLLEEILPKKSLFADFEVNYNFANIGERVMLLNAREITREKAEEKLILLAIEDVTEDRKHQQKERELLARFENLVLEAPVAIMVLKGRDYLVEVANDTFLQIVEKGKDFIGKPIFESLPELKTQRVKEQLDSVMQSGVPYHANELELQMLRNKKRVQGFYNIVYRPLRGEEGIITGIIVVANEVTEQVLSRKKVEESEQRFRNLVEKAPSPICILKGEDMILEVANEPVYKIWNVGKEALGKPFLKIIPEMKEQPFMGWLLDVFHNGVTHYGKEEPAYFTRENGEKQTIYFNFIYQPYRENDGTISGVMVLATDVTDQVLSRKKIEESEKHFRLLADLMPSKISNADIDGKVTYFNKQWLDFSGYSFEELKDLGYHKMMHPDEVKEFQERFKKAGETGTVLEMEMRFLNKEGIYKWHLNHAAPIKDEKGNIKMWVGVTTEIQLQKEHEGKLENAVKDRTHELVIANEELVQKNQEIALSKYNKRFLSEFSDKFSAYKGHNEFFSSLVQFIADTTFMDYVFVGKLVEDEKKQITIQTIALNAFGKLTENIHFHLPHSPFEQIIKGTLYSDPTLCRETFPNNKMIEQYKIQGFLSCLLNDDKGNAVGLIAVMHQKEIEDAETVCSVLKIVAKRAEIELDRIKNEEQLVQHNIILAEKNEELIKMNTELQAFTYVSSHDLQEPLRKIQNFISHLLETEKQTLSEKGNDYFQRIQESAKRMRTLIQDLLAFSHVTNTDRIFQYTKLNTIIDQVKVDLAETIKEKNTTIEVGESVEAKIIPFLFHQLFYNLISNSIKFSIPGKPVDIIIKSKIEEGPNLNHDKLSKQKRYCHISYSDNGIGFDPQYKDRIFGLFQRLHSKEEYPGTGVGLAIVKKIIDNHNGIITAKSEINKGATFDIYIPV